MNKIKQGNCLIIITAAIFMGVIGLLMYIGKLEIRREIQAVTSQVNGSRDETFEIWTIEGIIEEVLYEEIAIREKEYPHIHFKVKSFKSDIYGENLLNAARTGNLPDMFFTWGDQGLEDLVEMKKVKSIPPHIAVGLRHSLKNKALNSYTFKGSVYGVPLFGWDAVMYCRTDLFEEAGLTLPNTFEELIEVIERFKEEGIIPMTIGGSQAWMASLYYMELVLNKANVSEVINAVEHPELLAGPAFKQATADYSKLITASPWQIYYGEASPEDAMAHLVAGEAAMLVGGSWMSRDLERALSKEQIDHIKVIPIPVDKQIRRLKGVAGYSDGFALSEKASLKSTEVTTLFMKMVQGMSDNAVERKGVGLPVYINQSIEASSFEILKQCEVVFPAGEYHGAYDQLFDKEQAQKYNGAIKALIKGHITDETFIEEISGVPQENKSND